MTVMAEQLVIIKPAATSSMLYRYDVVYFDPGNSAIGSHIMPLILTSAALAAPAIVKTQVTANYCGITGDDTVHLAHIVGTVGTAPARLPTDQHISAPTPAELTL